MSETISLPLATWLSPNLPCDDFLVPTGRYPNHAPLPLHPPTPCAAVHGAELDVCTTEERGGELGWGLRGLLLGLRLSGHFCGDGEWGQLGSCGSSHDSSGATGGAVQGSLRSTVCSNG